MARDKESGKALVVKPSMIARARKSFLSFLGGRSVLCPFCLTENRFSNKGRIDKCLNCRRELPVQYVNNYEHNLPFFLQLIGLTAVGKTVYLQSLALMLKKMDRFWGNDYVCSALTDATRHFMQDVRGYEATGEMPMPTQIQLHDPYILLLQGMERWGSRTLVASDNAGEIFSTLQFPLEYMPYLLHVPTTLMMISIPDMERDQRYSVEDLMNSYVNTLSRYKRDYRNASQKIIIILSKADQFANKLPNDLRNYLAEDPFSINFRKNSYVDHSFMNEYMNSVYRNSLRIKEWFSQTQMGGQLLVSRAARENIQLYFTMVSSTGSVPGPDAKMLVGLNPLRVMDPFFLTLDFYSRTTELDAAAEQSSDAVDTYMRAQVEGGQIALNEAKLILVGEGEVGKTCLIDALLGNPWKEHDTTHGINIQQFKVTDFHSKKEITFNGWDFGGQRVYRPTHQLFFSAPAVYLVVWKPREGSQAGQVKEWIQLIKRREPTAKIIVVATHGGPQQRQPDIDRQELWDLFGKEAVIDFFFVESKPDEHGHRKGIEELKQAIARVAAILPEVGRSVPKSFADVRAALQSMGAPYLPLDEVLAICRAHNMDDEIARLFITISHRLGHLTHYENDPALRDIVILRPDWLATAMSYVLDDEETRNNQGLVKFSRLSLLWNDPTRPADTRYPEPLHRIFLRLMERFDLSYRVAGLSKDQDSNPVSLIAQLVPDTTPKEDKFNKAWTPDLVSGDIQQTQICRIVDAANSQSANAEGLFYQLIVRLHKYSMGRTHWDDSVHWQRGLVLDADYNGRALLRHIGNDVHITVRAPFPERFLGMLTEEVKYLVESFWEGLRCDVTVPCLATPDCRGLFEVSKLIENKKRNRHEQPCPICNEWQSIEQLLSNAPAATQPISVDQLLREFAEVKDKLDVVNDNTRRILSQVDKQYADLIQIFTDEAKEGPRLFSLFPLDGSRLNPKNWIRHQFRLVLWCEHARLPLPVINNGDMKKGVYDFELDQDWFKKAAPYLKLVTGTLSLVLPVASSALKVANDAATKALQDQIGLGKDVIDAIAGESTALNEFSSVRDSAHIERGTGIRAENATLRELHALLKAKDPGFGGLVRVMNKRQEFLWVHEKFAAEY